MHARSIKLFVVISLTTLVLVLNACAPAATPSTPAEPLKETVVVSILVNLPG